MIVYGKSITGRYRSHNEDSILIHNQELPFYAVVADGMGGAKAGEIASRTVIDSIASFIEDVGTGTLHQDVLGHCVGYANRCVLDMVDAHPEYYGMGSTLTMASFTNESINIAHVGDSAAFLFSNRKLKKLTKDHSYVQSLIDTGKYPEDVARSSKFKNFITKAMGMENLEGDYYIEDWYLGDILLLCTDGVSSVLSEEELSEILSRCTDFAATADEIISRAEEEGSRDNISVILCRNTVGVNSILSERYLLRELIGEGGFSHIYLASDVEEHKKIVVKILKEEFRGQYDVIRAFRKEASIGKSLNHKNIVNVYAYGSDRSTNYIAMDYVEGTTLKEIIREKKKIPVRDAVYIVRKICTALEYAHAKGITHGDIKPENIMISKSGEPSLMDFGVAGQIHTNKKADTNSIVASVLYISPEQAKSSSLDRRTDIYSLGIVFYEMIAGHVPFEGDSSIEIALKHINSPVPEIDSDENPDVTESIRRIILKSTAKDRSDRYRSALLMYQDIERCMDEPDGEYIDVGKIRPMQPAYDDEKMPDERPEKKKRHFWTYIIMTGVLAIIVVIIITVFSNFFNIVSGSETVVPNVVNMSLENAEYALKSNDLQGIITYSHDILVPEGNIIRQSPEPDTEVSKNSKVEIVVSDGRGDGK